MQREGEYTPHYYGDYRYCGGGARVPPSAISHAAWMAVLMEHRLLSKRLLIAARG